MSAQRGGGPTQQGVSQGTGANATKPRLDVLIQGATLAVFDAFGLAIAPQAPEETTFGDFRPDFPLGAVTLRQSSCSATLLLSIPERSREQLEQALGRRAEGRDLMRELVNQVSGCLKNRLAQYLISLQVSLPSIVERAAELSHTTASTDTLLVYPFRTIRGRMVVAIKGTLVDSALVYSGTANAAREGDVIEF
jgi:hypothetical protein